MIELTAKLGSAAYLPGDKVVCHVEVRNSAASGPPEIVAWASAQIHCVRATGSSRTEPAGPVTAVTAFAPVDPANVVLSTPPRVLCCDLRLKPGQSATFVFSEPLPPESPPSFRGQLIKLAYKVTVGAQRVNERARLARLPLRVLAWPGLADCTCEDSEELEPNNPFLDAVSKQLEVDAAFKLTLNITARRSPNFYNITNARGKVGRFCLFKQAYRLGEDIVGAFDFSTATVACFELTVTLQSEEKVGEAHRVPGQRESAFTSVSKCHEVCLGLKASHFILPIPLYVMPAFSCRDVSLSWRLHFEFVTTINPPSNDIQIDENKTTWTAPASVDIETMIWDLPVNIYPTLPLPDDDPPPPHTLSF